MRILYDHQMFCRQVYGGITRYFAELLTGLPQVSAHEPVLDLWFSWNHYLRQSPFVRWQAPPIKDKIKGLWMLECLANQFLSQKNLHGRGFDVFHPTYYQPFFLKNLGDRPFVLTIHDMIHERYRNGVGERGDQTIPHKKLLAEKAAAIIAVSEATRRDILHFYPHLNPDKIHVVYHGNSLQATDQPPSIIIPDNYLLYVGSRGGYKNFQWMVLRVAPLLRESAGLKLVCAGGKSFTSSEQALFQELRIADRLQQLSVSDTDLYHLYARARCFVFPSQYEGFGIPVLEAFAAECPVLLHRTSSLPEVGGDAALYFEEDERGDSILTALGRLLHDPAMRRDLVEKGRGRLQQFSWQRTASETAKVYEKAAG